MPIYIIPASQDPRRVLQNPTPRKPAQEFSTKDFPPFATNSFPWKPAAAKNTRTYADVLKNGANNFRGLYNQLPLEIREIILEHAMRAGGHLDKKVDVEECRMQSTNTIHPVFLPAVCWASKAMYAEATPVFIRYRTWIIRSKEANEFFTAFLENIPEDKGFKAVKHMWFTSFHWFPGVPRVGRSLDIKLMARCTGLNRVKFTFHVQKMTKRASTEQGYLLELKNIDELVEFYGLDEIFDVKDLRHLTLDGIKNNSVSMNCNGDPQQRVQELGDWIRDGFRKRNNQEVCIPPVEWRTWKYGYVRYTYDSDDY